MAKVFFSYAHEDEALRNGLEKHLAPLKREGVIEAWHDRRIGPGMPIHDEISDALEAADIVLLLVSSDFLASDYCHEVEMRRALERHEAGLAQVIPVILRPCDWHSAPFGHLRATPTDGKPASQHRTLDEAFLEVAQAVRQAAAGLGNPVARGTPRATPGARPSHQDRSSNLGIRRAFTDRDRHQFLDDGFEHIAGFFENSLLELKTRNRGVEASFSRIDADRFEAAVYLDGKEEGRCGIWRARDAHSSAELRYSHDGVGSGNSYNESLSVGDDGNVLFWNPLGMAHFGQDKSDQLTHQGAAEYLWGLLIAPLR